MGGHLQRHLRMMRRHGNTWKWASECHTYNIVLSCFEFIIIEFVHLKVFPEQLSTPFVGTEFALLTSQ